MHFLNELWNTLVGVVFVLVIADNPGNIESDVHLLHELLVFFMQPLLDTFVIFVRIFDVSDIVVDALEFFVVFLDFILDLRDQLEILSVCCFG